MSTYIITGIDTDVGKTYVTGMIAAFIKSKGRTVITQKPVQTGCENISEDIVEHRRICREDLFSEDLEGITNSYIFKLPASPHLAADVENKTVDLSLIREHSSILQNSYDYLLIEGAGGLLVPFNNNDTFLDYIKQVNYPVILVSSSKLGSINHTLLTLEVASYHGLDIRGIVYNHYPEVSEEILKDSRKVFSRYLKEYGYPDIIVDIPVNENGENIPIDFSSLIEI